MEIRITGLEEGVPEQIAERLGEWKYEYGKDFELIYGAPKPEQPWPVVGLLVQNPKAALVAMTQIVP